MERDQGGSEHRDEELDNASFVAPGIAGDSSPIERVRDQMTPDEAVGNWRPIARIAGWVFVLMFSGLAETVDGFRIQNYPPFSAIAQGEMMLWLGVGFLLVPGSILLGLGYAELIVVPLRALVHRFERSDSSKRAFIATLAFVVFAGVAWTGNTLFLGGYPVTDDEYAVKFGGQVLASGHVMVPIPPFADGVPMLFFFQRNGSFTSMDWLGPQIVWAIADLTHSGNLVWALLAAIAFVGVAIAAARRLGPRWGLVAAAFFAVSPMAIALSFSSHAHVASRAFFAVALVFLARAIDRSPSRSSWFLFGLAIGTSFLCRPFETAFLGLPIGLDLLWRSARRQSGAFEGLAATLYGFAIPLTVFCWYSWAITGNPLIPPRFVPGAAVPAELPVSSTWARFGNGVAFNALMLAVWFLGPVGVLLSIVGAWCDRYSRLLAAGVASVLALGLLHDNFGIHTVGPIHYSECVVPLTLLATYGLWKIATLARAHQIDFAPIASAVAVILVVAMGAFNAVTWIGLRRHADIQTAIYGRIDSLVPEASTKAIVLAPSFASIWKQDATFEATGSWVFVWRRPRPDYSDNVMILYDLPGIENRLRKAFPDRRIFRIVPGTTGTDFGITAVDVAVQPSGSSG